MTEQEIKNYFGANIIYRWNGTLDELADFMNEAGISYNYIVVIDVIYFIAQSELAEHDNAIVFADNTGSV